MSHRIEIQLILIIIGRKIEELEEEEEKIEEFFENMTADIDKFYLNIVLLNSKELVAAKVQEKVGNMYIR